MNTEFDYRNNESESHESALTAQQDLSQKYFFDNTNLRAGGHSPENLNLPSLSIDGLKPQDSNGERNGSNSSSRGAAQDNAADGSRKPQNNGDSSPTTSGPVLESVIEGNRKPQENGAQASDAVGDRNGNQRVDLGQVNQAAAANKGGDASVARGDASVASQADAPMAVHADMPVAAQADAPVVARVDEPVAPLGDAPVAPLGDAPVAARVDAPVAPLGDAPVAPLGDAPVAPQADAQVAPRGDAPVAAQADAPAAPRADAPAARPEVQVNPNRVENRADGSRVEFDRNTNLPVKAVDVNGNEYRYRYENGSSTPSYVSMIGPRTGNQLVEFRRNTTGDNVVNAVTSPSTWLMPIPLQFMQPTTNYTVTVDGREQPATLNFSAGAGLNAGPAAIGVGGSMPVQRNVDLRVGPNGALQIMQPGETVNGVVSNRLLTLTNNLDGSTTQEVRTGWFSRATETIRRDRNGRVID